MAHTEIKVGDILSGTWGYSMTIPCFYKVTKVTPTGVKVIELDKFMSQSGDGGYNQMGWELPRLSSTRRGATEQLARCIGEGYKIGSRYDARYLRPWNGSPVWANYMD